jgi:RHS repeat-associated protein
MITGQISGGFGGVTESHTYNNSLEYTSTKAISTVGTALNLSLTYSLTGGDNGTVTSITNNADPGRTQTLSYDPLNRILSAKSSAVAGVDCWGQTFGPDGVAADDAVANMTKINSGTQTQPPCPFGRLSATVDANNHINTDSTYAYDALGNMTKDGSGTGYLYTFDDEGRLTIATGPSGGPYCYVYDGNGLRVAKKSNSNSTCATGTVTKLYWRSISGDSLAETDSSGATNNSAYIEYVFFAGRRIASRTGAATGIGPIFYYFADQIGTTRSITTGNGTGQTPGQLCYDADFTPYGQEISYSARLQTTACPPNYRFTGYEYDSETGLHYAFARYYSARLGRFLSTDPLGGSIGNLQSHNAYAYTSNDPMNTTDPSGMGPTNGRRHRPRYPPRHAIDCTNLQTSMSGSGPGGCGNGDDGCSVDGAPTSCGVAFGLLSADAAYATSFLGYSTAWTANAFITERGFSGLFGSGFLDLLLGANGGSGSGAAKFFLKATEDRGNGGDRRIAYALMQEVSGTVSPAMNYTVLEDVRLRSGSLYSSNNPERPDKYGNSGYHDYISGSGTRDTTQTFTAWQPGGSPFSVFVRDVQGNDWGMNGIYVQGANGPHPAEIFVNGVPTPPGYDCVFSK